MSKEMTCNRCGFVGAEEYFSKSNRTKDGKRALCKACKQKADKAYRETHKKELAAYFHDIWVNDVNGRKEKNRAIIDKRRVGLSGNDFDNAICESCGMTNEQHKERYGCRLEVHHGQNTGRHNLNKGESPIHTDLHFLCKSCHARIGNLTHRNYKKGAV